MKLTPHQQRKAVKILKAVFGEPHVEYGGGAPTQYQFDIGRATISVMDGDIHLMPHNDEVTDGYDGILGELILTNIQL